LEASEKAGKLPQSGKIRKYNFYKPNQMREDLCLM
jgi:hypothetical protein